jgi:putative ATP-binding cassette transporter
LSDDEKHRLAVARVMLQRPLWVVIHNVLGLVDPASRRQIEAIFTGPLADVGVIHVGNDQNNSGFFTRTLHIVTDPNGPSFNPAHAVGASDPIQPPPQTLAAQ